MALFSGYIEGMLRFLITKAFLRCVRFACDAVTSVADLFHLALGRQNLIFAETKGKLIAPAAKRVAVVALHPDQYSMPFAVNLLKGLAQNGFYVLGVSSKKLPSDLSTPLLEHCHTLIERFPIGRDFASYQIGLKWIEKKSVAPEMDTLALVNDSLFYPKHMSEMIGDLLNDKGDWLALFENHQTRYHVQSFFQIFRKPIFTSEAFRTFWKRYIPFSSRRHTIARGEAKLTKTLISAGFTPSILYNSIVIKDALLSRLLREGANTDLYQLVRLTLTKASGSLREVIVGDQRVVIYEGRVARGLPLPENDGASLKMYNFASQIGTLAENWNPTHILGLLCNYLFEAPIKRDICLKGNYGLSDVLSFLQGFSDDEKQAMLGDLRRRGLPAAFPRFSWRGLKLAADV